MRIDKRVPTTARDRCRRIFDNPHPPEHVWEREFDYDDAGLQALARKDWRAIDRCDLANLYLLNLVYVEPLQPELFRYLFPLCLAVWHESLMSNQPWPLYPALRRPYVFDAMMTPRQRVDVTAFMVDSFMERLDQERSFLYTGSKTPAYAWLGVLISLGESVPLVESLWRRWWTLDSPGKAASALIYASGLIYAEGENPLFGVWTRAHGGGGPYLVDTDLGGWLPVNLDALRRVVTPESVIDTVERAAQVLRGEPEAAWAARVATDARGRSDIIAIQIEDLVEGLSH
jgi:hypothetical protein